jgi:hypothetical protein
MPSRHVTGGNELVPQFSVGEQGSCGTMCVSGLGLGCQMAIYRLLRNSPLKPEEISRLEAAYEQALRTLCVKERDDPLTEMIAKKIIKIAKTGIHDPTQIAARVIKELGIP